LLAPFSVFKPTLVDGVCARNLWLAASTTFGVP
jgi:hypothetical protein